MRSVGCSSLMARTCGSTEAAVKLVFQDYRAMGVPLQHFIDREGKVVDVWAGEDEAHALRVLGELGVN
jgi:hypothetical protein